jgi:hypothetical protein
MVTGVIGIKALIICAGMGVSRGVAMERSIEQSNGWLKLVYTSLFLS